MVNYKSHWQKKIQNQHRKSENNILNIMYYLDDIFKTT